MRLLFLEVGPDVAVFHHGWLDAGTPNRLTVVKTSTVLSFFLLFFFFLHVCGNLFRRKHQEIRKESLRGLLVVDIPLRLEIPGLSHRFKDKTLRPPPVSCLSLKDEPSLQVWCNSGYPRVRPIHILYGTADMPACYEVVPLEVPVNGTAACFTCSLRHNFVSVFGGKCGW